eukprot:INCI6159.10.p1 GENE.INCI6159.10~~INCI6159.10.p1  ORF type:complete len:1159 (-),score=207.26 INCI6159.10:832-4308(-)
MPVQRGVGERTSHVHFEDAIAATSSPRRGSAPSKKQESPQSFDSSGRSPGLVVGGNVQLNIFLFGLSQQARSLFVDKINGSEQCGFATATTGAVRTHSADDIKFWECVDDVHKLADEANLAFPDQSPEFPAEAAEHIRTTHVLVQLVDAESLRSAAARERFEQDFQFVVGFFSRKVSRMVFFIRDGEGATPVVSGTQGVAAAASDAAASQAAEKFANAHQAFYFAFAIHSEVDVGLVSSILRTEAFDSVQQLEEAGVTFVSPADSSKSHRSPMSDISPSPRSPAEKVLWTNSAGGGNHHFSGPRSLGSSRSSSSRSVQLDESDSSPISPLVDSPTHLDSESIAAAVRQQQQVGRQQQLAAAAAAASKARATPMQDRVRSLRPPTPPSQRHTKTSMLKFSRREDIKSPPTTGRGLFGTKDAHGFSAAARMPVAHHPRAWRAPMHFDGLGDPDQLEEQKRRQRALAKSLRRHQHKQPHSGPPALYVDVAVQRGGGMGIARSTVPVWNGSDSLQLAASFAKRHRLDTALVPTIGKLIAAEVRNWVEFELARQSEAKEESRRTQERQRELRHNLLASCSGVGSGTSDGNGTTQQHSSLPSTVTTASVGITAGGLKRTVTRTQPFNLSVNRKPDVLVQVPYEIDISHSGLLTIFRGDDPEKVVEACIRQHELPPASATALREEVRREMYSATMNSRSPAHQGAAKSQFRQKFAQRSRDIAAEQYRNAAQRAGVSRVGQSRHIANNNGVGRWRRQTRARARARHSSPPRQHGRHHVPAANSSPVAASIRDIDAPSRSPVFVAAPGASAHPSHYGYPSPSGQALALGELTNASPPQSALRPGTAAGWSPTPRQSSATATSKISSPSEVVSKRGAVLFVLKVEVAPGIHRPLPVRAGVTAQDTAAAFVSADGLPPSLVPHVVGLIHGSFGQYTKLLSSRGTNSTKQGLEQTPLARSLGVVGGIAGRHESAEALQRSAQTNLQTHAVLPVQGTVAGPAQRNQYVSETDDDTVPHVSDSDDDKDVNEGENRTHARGQSNSASETAPALPTQSPNSSQGDADDDDSIGAEEEMIGPTIMAARDLHKQHVDVKVMLRGGKSAMIQMGLLDSALEVATSFVQSRGLPSNAVLKLQPTLQAAKNILRHDFLTPLSEQSTKSRPRRPPNREQS